MIFSFPDASEINSNYPLGSSQNPNFKFWTPANIVTITRLLLTVVFLVLFVQDIHRTLALVIYAVAASTDWLDGQIARRTQTVSWYGKILDPICDRVLLFTGVLALVLTFIIPVWIAIFVILRDCYLAFGSNVLLKYRKRPLDVIYSGKIATALLMFGFTSALMQWPMSNGINLIASSAFPLLNGEPAALGLALIYLGCIFSLITAVKYTYQAYTIIKAIKLSQK